MSQPVSALSSTGGRLPRGSLAEDDPALGQIVGRQFDMYAVSNDRSDSVATHLASCVADETVLIVEDHAETAVGQNLIDRALHRNELFFRQPEHPCVRKVTRTDEFRCGARKDERDVVPTARHSAGGGNQYPSQTTLGNFYIAECKEITMPSKK